MRSPEIDANDTEFEVIEPTDQTPIEDILARLVSDPESLTPDEVRRAEEEIGDRDA